MDIIIWVISVAVSYMVVAKISYQVGRDDGYIEGFEESNDIWMDKDGQ